MRDIDEDYYYEPVPSETPSNELEAKYERYLEDLYYDEEEDVVPQELLEEVVEGCFSHTYISFYFGYSD